MPQLKTLSGIGSLWDKKGSGFHCGVPVRENYEVKPSFLMLYVISVVDSKNKDFKHILTCNPSSRRDCYDHHSLSTFDLSYSSRPDKQRTNPEETWVS